MDGASLATLSLERKRALPVEVCVRMAQDVARELHAAHARGSAHGNIKPSNIVVVSDGRARPINFADPARAVRGSYRSPEQVRGAGASALGDQFSLGVVLWESLAGVSLFSGDGATIAVRILECRVPRLATVREDMPRELDLVLQRMLRARPEERYPSCAEVFAALEVCLRAMSSAPATVSLVPLLTEHASTAATLIARRAAGMAEPPRPPRGTGARSALPPWGARDAATRPKRAAFDEIDSEESVPTIVKPRAVTMSTSSPPRLPVEPVSLTMAAVWMDAMAREASEDADLEPAGLAPLPATPTATAAPPAPLTPDVVHTAPTASTPRPLPRRVRWRGRAAALIMAAGAMTALLVDDRLFDRAAALGDEAAVRDAALAFGDEAASLGERAATMKDDAVAQLREFEGRARWAIRRARGL